MHTARHGNAFNRSLKVAQNRAKGVAQGKLKSIASVPKILLSGTIGVMQFFQPSAAKLELNDRDFDAQGEGFIVSELNLPDSCSTNESVCAMRKPTLPMESRS